MKEWFKYEFGFVNIDADNIYLTNTGVWSETQELVNKNIRNGNSNILQRTQMKVFLILYVIIVAALILYDKIRGLGIITSLAAIFILYRSFKPEMGMRFFIPIKNVRNIEIYQKSSLVYYKDSQNNIKTLSITNIENKGIKILIKLKEELDL